MFTHLIPKDDQLIHVEFESYAERHFLKSFEKKYGQRQWSITLESIKQDISRIGMESSDIQRTQQVDELWHNDQYWIFKYDFRVAQTKESTKTSGNRCICFLDLKSKSAKILLIFGKSDLPKNMGEQAYIEKTLKDQFPSYLNLNGNT